jgi:hypothetical protein
MVGSRNMGRETDTKAADERRDLTTRHLFHISWNLPQLILFLPTTALSCPCTTNRSSQTTRDTPHSRYLARLAFSINHRTIVRLFGQTNLPTLSKRRNTPRKPGYTNALGMCSTILHSAASMNAERAAIEI